jgi:type IV secretion system protein VirB6
MQIPTYATIILKLTAQINLITDAYTLNGYKTLAAVLNKPLGAACVLYISLTGFGIMRGIIKTPVQEFTKSSIRIGIVYLFAMNWGVFSEYVVSLTYKASSELGGVLMQINPLDVPIFTGTGINGALQSVLIEIIRVGTWTWAKGSLMNPGPLFTAFIIYLSGCLVVGLAFFEIVVAKLMMTVCYCVAPLFVSFTLFDKTRTFFDKWLGNLFGYSFVLIFVSSVVGLALSLVHWSIGAHYLEKAIHIRLVSWVPLCFCAALCVMAILEASRLGKSIGGACSSGHGSAMVGGFVGSALGIASQGGALLPSKGLVSRSLKSASALTPHGAQKAAYRGMEQVKQRFTSLKNHLQGGS